MTQLISKTLPLALALLAACDVEHPELDAANPDALAFGCPIVLPTCAPGRVLSVDYGSGDADRCLQSGPGGVFGRELDPPAPTCSSSYPELVVQPGADECVPSWCGPQSTQTTSED